MVFQALNIADGASGKDSGGKDRIRPLGKPDRATEIPAIW